MTVADTESEQGDGERVEGEEERAPTPMEAEPSDSGFPLVTYTAVALVLLVTVWQTMLRLRPNINYPGVFPPFMGDFLVGGWVRWDGGWYLDIAANGYTYDPTQASSVAFFPSYPLAMRLVQLVVRDPGHALPGVLVTVASGLGAAVLFHRWCLRRPGAGVAVARSALFVLLLYPYAWYLYGAAYADALFLVSVLAAFTLIEHDRPVLAGLVGMVATAGRPVGMGVVAGLAAVHLARQGLVVLPFLDRVQASGWRGAWREVRAAAGTRWALVSGLLAVQVAWSRLRPRDGGVLLAGGGLAAWMWYLGRTFGDPLLFVHIQSAPGWQQPQGPETWFKIRWLIHVKHLPEYLREPDVHWDILTHTLGLTFQALLVMGALCLVPAVVRRVGWGYAVYVLGVVAIPLLGSKDWQGTGRYLLAAFPVFFIAGGWLAGRPRLRAALLVPSAVLLVFLTSSFARGFYLA
jgi:hypothetical protein